MNNTNYTFTVQDGIQTQQEFLAKWKNVLQSKVYAALQAECAYRNSQLSSKATGYDVFRGQDLTQYVLNLMNQIKP